MEKFIKNFLAKHYVPRWLVLLGDVIIVTISLLFTYLLRFTFNFSEIEFGMFAKQAGIILPAYIFGFWMFKSYCGIIRHTTLYDSKMLFNAMAVGSGGVLWISLIGRYLELDDVFTIPFSIIMIHFLISTFLLIACRFTIKSTIDWLTKIPVNKKNIVIYGAGSMGKITRRVLHDDQKADCGLVAFIDDNHELEGKRLDGIPVFSREAFFSDLINKKSIDEVIIAINRENIGISRKKKFIEWCLERGIFVKEIPPVREWLNGSLSPGQIRKIKLDDLLGREPINLDFFHIHKELRSSVVLVTGAAGSIGSEIVRQLLVFKPLKVILLDHAESPLYDFQQELLSVYSPTSFEVVVACVSNKPRIRQIFERYCPDIVFNAAAYKHVPLMEENPSEAVKVNVLGTRILADLSIEFGVKKFVMISTDKAVNPTNVMGASKRICEMYIQSLALQHGIETRFITTRFGNVLGSNGSVVPLFSKQIAAGGPVTLTHKEITRYFMTIHEACQLVLQASFIGKGGEIFVFDMGEQVKIYDLARKMIMLSGLRPHKDIEIKFTGLRPGEKLYEELLASRENTMPTDNKKILIGNIIPLDNTVVKNMIDKLIKALETDTDLQLVIKMKEIVPEFISQNSIFSNYDKIKVEGEKIDDLKILRFQDKEPEAKIHKSIKIRNEKNANS
jgi:FlaA1/EpsC-like NDP-sugar epimerase